MGGVEGELRRLQEAQVTEIDAKCREIDQMKAQLEGDVVSLQRERDELSAQLDTVREELDQHR